MGEGVSAWGIWGLLAAAVCRCGKAIGMCARRTDALVLDSRCVCVFVCVCVEGV